MIRYSYTVISNSIHTRQDRYRGMTTRSDTGSVKLNGARNGVEIKAVPKHARTVCTYGAYGGYCTVEPAVVGVVTYCSHEL